MGIYNYIMKINHHNKRKMAVSITMDSGEIIKCTYGVLFEKANQYAKGLEMMGVKRGDRIVIVAENSPEWQMAFLAIMKLKTTAVLIDASLAAEDLIKLIQRSDARAIYVSDKVKNKIGESTLFRVPVLRITKDGTPYPDSYKVLSPFVEKTVDADPEIAMIIYSSGTTKAAAGIMHTHDAMIKTIMMTARENDLSCDDRILSLLPNSHIYGVVTGVLGAMMLGASLHYVESINNENILSAFKTFKPTVFPCVPKVFEMFENQIIRKMESKDITKKLYEKFYPICLRVREQTGLRLGKFIFRSVHKAFGGKLDLMTSAGAPLDEKTALFYYAMGFDLLITYGLTETNIPIIGNRGEHITVDSCGTPYPRIEFQLAHVDETGEGEIYIRSPYMMRGYFRDEEATRAAFDKDGWFKTGDLARVDAYGNVKITGRSKENIVLATGKKVAPTDIENSYTSIPGVEELVISGVPISGDHDEIHAFIVKESPHVDDHHILKAIQERGAKLSQYMKVAKVHFLEEIPKTSLQKPKRYLLKKHALQKSTPEADLLDEVSQLSDSKVNHLVDSNEASGNNLENIQSTLRNIVIKITGLDEKLVRVEAKLMSEVGVDSLVAIEFNVRVEEKYQVNIEHLLKQDASIQEIADFINGVKIPQSSHLKHTEVASKEIIVRDKNLLHYIIFKAHCLLAHVLYRVKTTYSERIPEDKGYIICANHVSNIDYLWIAQGFNKTRFSKFCCLAKKEIFKNSFISHLLRDICGMIPVDRGKMNFEVMHTCKKQLQDHWGLLIHPEGTRSHTGELGVFKKGAATIAIEANVPIIPVYIKGAHEIFPRGRKLPKFFNWQTKHRYQVEVIYGEPIEPTGLSSEVLIQKVELAIKALMQGQTQGNQETEQAHLLVEQEVVEADQVADLIHQEEMTLGEFLDCDYEIDLLEEDA